VVLLTGRNVNLSVLSRTALSRGLSGLQGFTVMKDGNEVVECFPATVSIIVKASGDLRDEVQDSIDRAGLREIQAQYTPSSLAKTSSREFDRVRTASGSEILTSMQTNSADLGHWLQEIMSLEGDGTGLVLDTNIIMKHYVRNLLHPVLGQEILRKMQIRIPRLCLLEIERQFNEPRVDSRKEAKEKKRRLALYAARETLFLKTVGAEFLPDLKDTTLQGFSRIAGEKFSDAWIRREVKEYRQTRFSGGAIYHPLVFATCDLMNALAASAEGLAVLYFSRMEERDSYAYRDMNQVAELIVDLAVSLSKIEIGNAAYEGLWEGKTIWQWEADCVRAIPR